MDRRHGRHAYSGAGRTRQRGDDGRAGAGGVDIYRNNVPVHEDVPNTPQPYRDTISGKGGGTFTYRVCNAGGTATCSNTVTVAF